MTEELGRRAKRHRMAVVIGLEERDGRRIYNSAVLIGRDGRLLLVAVGALLGAPVAALVAVTATSALSLGLRVAFLRRPPDGPGRDRPGRAGPGEVL